MCTVPNKLMCAFQGHPQSATQGPIIPCCMCGQYCVVLMPGDYREQQGSLVVRFSLMWKGSYWKDLNRVFSLAGITVICYRPWGCRQEGQHLPSALISFLQTYSATALESGSAGNLGNSLNGVCWCFGHDNVLYRTWQCWKQKTDVTCQRQMVSTS